MRNDLSPPPHSPSPFARGANGCDLWEEVQSNDFYWNRMAFVYSLHAAADFADALGEAEGDGFRDGRSRE